jgi:hypothetical protein
MAMVFLHQSVSFESRQFPNESLPDICCRVVAAICAPVYILYLPSIRPSDASLTISSRIRSIDWIGIVLSTGTMVTFCMAFTFAGTAWAWNDHRTIVMFVVLV